LISENAELLGKCADYLERSPLTGHSLPLSSCARRVRELALYERLA